MLMKNGRTREQQDRYNENRRKKYTEDSEYKEKVLARNSTWQKENREHVNQLSYKWSRNNRGKKNAAYNRRRARLLNQTPDDANHVWINLIYEHCPEGHHVDHIVALANGGPHHEDNLQYLTASDNCRKGAR